MFELNAAGFEVNGRRLLHPTDLGFREGLVYGLIGHNGSGKSTLLKLLGRQQRASFGRVCLDGRPVDDWGTREFACQVAYLPQNLPSANSLTAHELVAFGRYPRHGLLGRTRADDKARIERALTLTDTLSFADRLVDSLSGGERQRVWLAMLLAQGSRFLLLDEPLAALDIAHQIDTLTLVDELCHSLNLGVIIVLHDINMASRYCDRLIALREGRLLAQGAPGDLMSGAMLKAIYDVRMSVVAHPTHDCPIAVIQ